MDRRVYETFTVSYDVTCQLEYRHMSNQGRINPRQGPEALNFSGPLGTTTPSPETFALSFPTTYYNNIK